MITRKGAGPQGSKFGLGGKGLRGVGGQPEERKEQKISEIKLAKGMHGLKFEIWIRFEGIEMRLKVEGTDTKLVI